jgi:hypothetical protein
VHKILLLVHSLWEKLWIEIFFYAYMASDLRKDLHTAVDKFNFCADLNPQP